VVELDRAAVEATVELLRKATDADWARPTPCGTWNLAELTAHLTVQHHGFAAASEGAGNDLGPWQPVLAEDPFGAYEQAAERVIAAFGVPGVLEREFRLPELSTEIAFPGARAIGFHYLDYVVHAWDVARTLDVPVPLGKDVIAPVLPIAQQVPGGERRLLPGAAFKPAVDDGGSTDTLDQIVALLGRDPRWKP